MCRERNSNLATSPIICLLEELFFPTLPCGFFVFLAASRRLRLRLRLPSRRLHLNTTNNNINTTSSTHHHQQHTINTTPSTTHHQHITIHTTSSTQHHPHNTINTASSTLAAPQCDLAWQVQHLYQSWPAYLLYQNRAPIHWLCACMFS